MAVIILLLILLLVQFLSFPLTSAAPAGGWDCTLPYAFEGRIYDPQELPRKLQEIYSRAREFCEQNVDCVLLYEDYARICKGIPSLRHISVPDVSPFTTGPLVIDATPEYTEQIGPILNVTFTNGLQPLRACVGETPLQAVERFCEETNMPTLLCNDIRLYYIELLVRNGNFHPSLPLVEANYRPDWNSWLITVPYNGISYRHADAWFPFVPVFKYYNKPIKYLEIGVLTGANALSVAYTYGNHPDAELHLIDPWAEYGDYSEYLGFQASSYELFMRNMILNPKQLPKLRVHREYSNIQIPRFEDNYFDIIYIDGNHQAEYALEDAVLSFRKLRVGGYMIFDDYNIDFPDKAMLAVDAFARIYGAAGKLKSLGFRDAQYYLQRIA